MIFFRNLSGWLVAYFHAPMSVKLKQPTIKVFRRCERVNFGIHMDILDQPPNWCVGKKRQPIFGIFFSAKWRRNTFLPKKRKLNSKKVNIEEKTQIIWFKFIYLLKKWNIFLCVFWSFYSQEWVFDMLITLSSNHFILFNDI